MLPSELLLVTKRRGKIWPRYARLSDENLKVAKLLIKAYGSHIGEKKLVTKKLVSELEDMGYDYRFIRGLSLLLDRRSNFTSNVEVDPVNVRRKLYQATRKHGLPTTSEGRSRIIASVASELSLTPKMVEEYFYADLDSELTLAEFDPPPPQELLKNYNVSLTQTLLFNSTELNFTTSGNWQEIFYTIKRLGLIYDAYPSRGFWVKIDGPASLFKLTRRYGTALAKLLPAILADSEWTVKAKILWKYTNEICDLEIQSRKHGAVLKTVQPPTIAYDSHVEESFATRFQALNLAWHLRREPEPVLAGKYVILPDFSFEREGAKVYMEVVGFWTAEYLRRKIEKLKKVDVNMVVTVDENLACEKLEKLRKHPRLDILYYKRKIPLTPILRYLERVFQQIREKQTQLVRNLPITFVESVVDYKELASRLGVSTESVRTVLTEKPPQGYRIFPNSLVRIDKLKEIESALRDETSQKDRLPLSKAMEIFDTEEVGDAPNILKALGYRIVWSGINPEEAEVIKQESAEKKNW